MKEEAEAFLLGRCEPASEPEEPFTLTSPQAPAAVAPPRKRPPTDETEVATVGALRWTGEIPAQKWMNFYTRVLSKFATGTEMKLTLTVEVMASKGISSQEVEETKVALRELGLDDNLENT